ncbi:MAG: immunity 17 family protein [Candidatus Eremiobacteraeota bacterium]|nr:immunity 17 family protein [Candidatus Eremiobacteraeota bacterium]
METFIKIFVICAGLFSICGALFNWEWYFNHRKARALVKLIGRPMARVFYFIIGAALVTLGVCFHLGIMPMR